ncbi:MAG: hypothetical protein J6Y28_09790 [Acholeplasmatales bacterium]|nr:hypothetical protein [Methanobrevibacter sp.]MBP5446450.1 hypothetical protein [Acholeplasmatales bacterium]
MDIFSFLNNSGTIQVPNPNYKPKSKNNIEPPYITVPSIHTRPNAAVELAKESGFNQYSVTSSEVEKYRNYGLNWNPRDAANGSLDRQLAESQSASSKFMHALEQAIVSEVGIGTLKGISDLIDGIGQAIGASDHDYSNPVSRKLEEWQETFNNDIAPIYTTPGVDISNGGLLDAGWWASNIPSVMSSLTLLIPSTGVVKGVSYLGKLAKVGQGASKLGRITASSAKWAARATRLSKSAAAQKAYAGLRNLTELSSGTKATLGVMAENGVTALLSRTMENYQEARQTYDDMYEHASDAINKMKPEEYDNFLRRNAYFLEGVDTNNKDEVAKAVAKESADKTFAMDFANIGFDILQLYALRNMTFKGFRNQPSRASIRRKHLNSIKYAGMDDAEIAAKRAEMSFLEKSKDKLGDWFYGGRLAVGAQLSEGVEEAVNYVAQQEGMNLGHVMLGEIEDNTFARRLAEYAKAPGLWESAFWGTLGGIVFQELGSGFNRAQNAIAKYNDRKKYKEDAKTKEKVEKPTWKELWQTPELKRRIGDVEARNGDLQDFLNKLDMIENKSLNPYETDENGQARGISNNEKQMLKEKAYTDMLNKMTLRALDSGNFDLLKEYLSSDEIKQVIINSGAVSASDATRYQQDAIKNMEAIEKQYDANVITLNNLTKKLNTNRKEPIPVEYIQLIARNNIEHQLQIKDWEAQLAAWEIEGNEQQEQFRDKLDPNVNYKSAVRLVFLSNQLGELENQKRKLLADKKFINSVSGQQELDFLNNQIEAIRDMIYNLEPDNAVGNLLFTIQNALAYEKDDTGVARHNWTNADYLTFRTNIIELENTEDAATIERIDKYLAELDPRLAGVGKNDIMRHKLLDDNIRRAYDDNRGLTKISQDLHDTFFRIADLQTAIALERNQIKLTEDEVLNEVSAIHNFLNEARKKAIDDANATLAGLAKTYGSDVVRQALYDRYQNNTVKEDYFGTEGKAISDARTFNDALDILNLDSAANRNLFGYIDELLKLQDAISAAQGENSSTSEETISATQTEQADNTLSEQVESDTKQKEQIKPTIPQSETPLQKQSQTSQNGVITLKENGVEYATLIPNSDIDGSYTLNILNNNPSSLAYLNNEDFYTKDGVSLTEDYIISEKPVVRRNKDGSLTPVRKGLIIKASEDNIAKEEEKQVAQAEAEAASPSSTGGVVQTEIPIAPIPVATNVAATNEYVSNQTQSNADVVSGNAANEIGAEVRDALKKGSAIDWNNLRERMMNKYLPSAEDKADTERLIDTAIRSWKGIYERKISNKSNVVDDALVMNSSITEKTRTNKALLDDFYKAIDKLVEKYIKDVAADKSDGKYYVRVEDLLRYCNNATETQTTAQLLFNNLVEYMNSSDKYIVIDGNLSDAINKANQSARTRINQLSTRNGLYGINFEGFVSTLVGDDLKKVLDVVNNLNLGDKIAFTTTPSGIRFTVNDVMIGSLPIPKIGSKGEHWQYNDGWKTDILDVKGTKVSALKDLFKKWILNPDNNVDIQELNDIVIQAAFDKLEQSDLNNLAKQLLKNKEFLKAKKAGFVSDTAESYILLNGLAKLWGYTRQANGLTKEETTELRELSVDKWFDDEVAPSFDMAEALAAKDNGEVIVGKISEGELIRIDDEKDAIPVFDAIGEKHKGQIKIAAAEKIGKLSVAGKGINGQISLDYIGIAGGIGYGNSIVVIPSRSGNHGYVHAFPQPISSSQFTPKIKEIVAAVFAEIDRIGEEGTVDEIYDNLEKFITYLLNKPRNANTPLFRVLGEGISIYRDRATGEKLGFSIVYKKRNKDGSVVKHIVTITNKGRKDGKIYKRSGLTAFVDGTHISDNTKESINALEDFIKKRAVFNIGFNFINSDNNTSLQFNSLAYRDKDTGEFIIEIPNQGKFTFDSFNSFVIDNNLISLTTRPAPDGTNYRKGASVGNQAANQVLKVKLKVDTSTLVEEGNNEPPSATQTTVAKVLDILANSKNSTTTGRRIAKLILGNKVKNLKINNKILDLFPQNLIFVDENIGYNAITNIRNKAIPLGNGSSIIIQPGQVVVGREWFNLLNGTIAQREEAVRKLVHERLHLILHSNGNEKYIEQIRDIFNEFVAKSTNENLNKYKFNDTAEQEARYRTDGKLNEEGFEEFLVETLTSKELAEELNSIQVEEIVDNKPIKKSLLQKIMERLANIFGWNIKEGSLYEKEFNVLRNFFEETKTGEDITTGTQTATQLEFNFDEPVTEKKIEQEEEIKETPTEEKKENRRRRSNFSKLYSSIQESQSNTFANTSSFINKLPFNQQAEVIDKLDKGEIQTSCR